MWLTFIVCFIIIGVILFFCIIEPLFLKQIAAYFDENIPSEKNINFQVNMEILGEFEKDFYAGKISEDDFQKLSIETKKKIISSD